MTSVLPKPPPLTPAQKWAYGLCLVAGLIVIVIGAFFLPDDLPSLLTGAILGVGGGMTALGFVMLFYRPDRGVGGR
jgi:hypothetical protein